MAAFGNPEICFPWPCPPMTVGGAGSWKQLCSLDWTLSSQSLPLLSPPVTFAHCCSQSPAWVLETSPFMIFLLSVPVRPGWTSDHKPPPTCLFEQIRIKIESPFFKSVIPAFLLCARRSAGLQVTPWSASHTSLKEHDHSRPRSNKSLEPQVPQYREILGWLSVRNHSSAFQPSGGSGASWPGLDPGLSLFHLRLCLSFLLV